jgi:hypothetical protein
MWVLMILGAVAVFVVAAVTVGRESFRLGHQPPPTIFDLDEAVAYVGDHLSEAAQARLTYDEVRVLIQAELEHLRDEGIFGRPGEDPALAAVARLDPEATDVVVEDDDAVAFVLGEADAVGLDVTDEDAYEVVTALHAYLDEIGAVGPQVGRS